MVVLTQARYLHNCSRIRETSRLSMDSSVVSSRGRMPWPTANKRYLGSSQWLKLLYDWDSDQYDWETAQMLDFTFECCLPIALRRNLRYNLHWHQSSTFKAVASTIQTFSWPFVGWSETWRESIIWHSHLGGCSISSSLLQNSNTDIIVAEIFPLRYCDL